MCATLGLLAGQPGILTAWRSVAPLLAPAIALLLPIALALSFGAIALRDPEATGRDTWSRFRGFGRLVLTVTVAAWWAIWELQTFPRFVAHLADSSSNQFSPCELETLFFWLPPLASLGVFLILCYGVDRRLLKQKWSTSQLLWRAWWKLVALVLPLLMLSAGCQDLLAGRIWGFAWLAAAGAVAKFGTGFSRWADGMNFRLLRSGEIHNHAFTLAKEMNISLHRVFIVPSGKGRLTNAFGTTDSIGLTDNLGKYLTRDQIHYAIAHELSHVKLKHGRQHLRLILGVYSAMFLILFLLAPLARQARAVIPVVVLLFPLILEYWFSRRLEFAADKEALQFTEDPETAIRALARLYKSSELPPRRGTFAEIFMTHPSFEQRVRTIAHGGEVPMSRLSAILREERLGPLIRSGG